MWLLDNVTPFAAERTWVRGRDGAESWVVAVRALFVVDEDNVARLAPEQPPVSRMPVFRGDPLVTSLECECDLVPGKTRTDVLVEGEACSPLGRPATAMTVRLQVGERIDKTLRIVGDRRWERGLLGPTLGAPAPFTRMPIVYERAFGGTDQRSHDRRLHRWEARNPVGCGFAVASEHLIGQPAPNVEAVEAAYSRWDDGLPAGFGPIARHWMPRVALAGRYDEQWERSRKPLVPLDFDDRFYQCAPDDQQVEGFLKGGETISLAGMTPEGAWNFRLPRIALALTTRFYDGTLMPHRASIHTLTLLPAQRRFSIVWHSDLPCHAKVNQLKGTRVALKRRVDLSDAGAEDDTWRPASQGARLPERT